MDIATLALQDFAANLTAEERGGRCVSAVSAGTATAPGILRRCRTREQGIALITVGHAIEYLVQSRLIQQPTTTGAERQALAILLSANLAVYSEGAEIVPMMSRLRRWFHGGSQMKAATAR